MTNHARLHFKTIVLTILGLVGLMSACNRSDDQSPDKSPDSNPSASLTEDSAKSGAESIGETAEPLWKRKRVQTPIPRPEFSGPTPTHFEVDPIQPELPGARPKIESMSMDSEGRLWCAVSWDRKLREGEKPKLPKPPYMDTTPRGHRVQVYAQDNTLLNEFELIDREITYVACLKNDQILVGQEDGTLSICDTKLNPIHSIKIPEILDGAMEKASVGGSCSSNEHIYIAFANSFSLRSTEDIVRFDSELSNPELIIEKQFGCCAHLDMDIVDEKLLIAENSRHRVNTFTKDGELESKWGKRDRENIEGFAACCNPVNFDIHEGTLFTAESGIGRIKRYSPNGEYLGLVGYVDTTKFIEGSTLAASTCYIPIEVGDNGDRIFIVDARLGVIRVLEKSNE